MALPEDPRLPSYPLSRKLLDIAAAYAAALVHAGLFLLLGLLVLAALTALSRRIPARIAGAIGLVAAVAWAWHLRSLFDDAYISLRYAANLAHGNGLVFNPGERVEGFTNLLWTVLLAGAIRLGFDGPHVAVLGCLAAFAAELLLVARLGRMLRSSSPPLPRAPLIWLRADRAGPPPNARGSAPITHPAKIEGEPLAFARLFAQMRGARGSGGEDDRSTPIPYAAIVLGAGYTFASFGTSGMETMLSTLLMTLALERALSRSPALAGLCATLSIVSHPDNLLLCGALGLAILLHDGESRAARIRSAVIYGVTCAAVYIPVFAWRWHYYGDVFPNTYYAKSADQSYFGQGLIYLTASLFETGLWALAPLAAVAMARRPRRLLTIFTMAGVPLLLFYVARIGGDFMLGRLLVPLLPAVALLAELGAHDALEAGMLQWRPLAALALLACAATPARLLQPREERWNIADERTWYPIVQFWPHVTIDSEPADRTAILQELVRQGLRPIVAELNVGQESYETELPMIDLFGLTDRTIAHQPIRERGRPGHEKVASVDYLRSRGVQLSAMPLYPIPYGGKTRVRVHNRQFFLACYDPALIRAFEEMPGALVPKMGAIIDDYLRKSEVKPSETLTQDLAFFDSFYFACNQDGPRRTALKALAAR